MLAVGDTFSSDELGELTVAAVRASDYLLQANGGPQIAMTPLELSVEFCADAEIDREYADNHLPPVIEPEVHWQVSKRETETLIEKAITTALAGGPLTAQKLSKAAKGDARPSTYKAAKKRLLESGRIIEQSGRYGLSDG